MNRKIGIADYFDDGGKKYKKYWRQSVIDRVLKEEKKAAAAVRQAKSHICARCGDMCEEKRYSKDEHCPSCHLYIDATCSNGYFNAIFCDLCYASRRVACSYSPACAYATAKVDSSRIYASPKAKSNNQYF